MNWQYFYKKKEKIKKDRTNTEGGTWIMDYQNASQYSKRMVLENAVLTKSPEEIVILYQQLGEVECSARALGLACRFLRIGACQGAC